MKTKTFFLICLFLGIGLTQLTAQLPKNIHGTGSVAYDYPNMGWFTDVYCDGVWIDFLTGSGDAHVVDHYKNGEIQWEMVSFSGTGTNSNGEKFTFSELDKYWIPKEHAYTCSTHVKGDKGALYNLYFRWDDYGFYVVQQATCTGNTK